MDIPKPIRRIHDTNTESSDAASDLQFLAFLVSDRTIDQIHRTFGVAAGNERAERLHKAHLIRRYRVGWSQVLWFSLTPKGRMKLRDAAPEAERTA